MHQRTNDTFRDSGPFYLNACVGDNGSPNKYTFARGFTDAAIALSKLVVDGKGGHLVDCFVYPICFNMRHGVELWLKLLIEDLHEIRKHGEISNNIKKCHDIKSLWGTFKEDALKKDVRLKGDIDQLNDFIDDIGEIDSTGQTFRYPASVEDIKHLTQMSNINILTLLDSFATANQCINNLFNTVSYLRMEYATETFTENLSRGQLFEIAVQLPEREAWADDGFASVKKKIKSDFSISSNELSKALNIIQKNYELAASIGMVLPLKSATNVTFRVLMVGWKEAVWPNIKSTNRLCLRNANDIIEDFFETLPHNTTYAEAVEVDELYKTTKIDIHNKFIAVCNSILLELTPDEIVDIVSIYLLSEECFSELYQKIYDDYLNQVINGDLQCADMLMHYMRKTNLPERLIKGLKRLGQHKLLDEFTIEFGTTNYE